MNGLGDFGDKQAEARAVAGLVEFEAEVAAAFNAGKIRAPVHLSGGNEARLVNVFRRVRPRDWIASTWRSHLHCLLKGVPREQLMADILAGRSITLCYPEQRVFSSAIVAGALPIALGIAWTIKRARGDEKVWAFIGDMAARTGTFAECERYAMGHDLPIEFVIEDNGVSVCTNTREAWGSSSPGVSKLTHYRYHLVWPHSGAGARVNF